VTNRVEIVVGAQDNSKLDLASLQQRLRDMGKMIETARVRVAGDKEAALAVERLALKMAALGRKSASPRIGLEGAARAEVDIAAVGVALDKLGDKSAAAEAKVGSSGSGLSGALSRLGRVLGGTGGVAAGALGLGLAGPLAAAGLAMGAFGAVAIPILSKVSQAQAKLTAAQAQYAKAATASGRATALKAEAAATAGLTDSQKGLMGQVGQLKSMWDRLENSMTPVVVGVASMALKLGTALMPAMDKLVPAGAKVIDAFLAPLTRLLASPMFATFITQMSTLAEQVAPMLGLQLTRLLVVFLAMFTQAGPAAVQVLNQLLPAIVDMASGLVPVVVLVTKAAASVLNWLAANHLLIPALIAVGAAVAIASGGLTLIIPAIALAAGGIVHLWQTSQRFRDIVTTVFSNVGQQLATFAGLWLDEWHFMSDSLLTAVHQVLVGVQGIARVMDLVMGTHLAAAVTTALRNLDGFHSGVDRVFNAAHSTLEGWKRDLAAMPRIVALKGDISDLTAKLGAARAQLRDPHLTATRRAVIQANIAQLLAAVARARAELAAVDGTVATTFVQTVMTGVPARGGGRAFASGGVTGAAGGGPRGNLTLVGEHGAELVTLPPGAMVHSNPDTQRMMDGGGYGPLEIRLIWDSSFTEAGLSPQMIRNIKASVRHLGGRGGGNVQIAFGN